MFTLICGTNRADAVSRKILAIYKQKFEQKNQPVQSIDLRDLPQDFMSEQLYHDPSGQPVFEQMIHHLNQSDKYLFVVPEYNGSFPGVLKVFIDGLPYPRSFRHKKAALVGLSSGIQGAGLALSHLTDILNYCGCHVLAFKPKLSNISKHLGQGQTLSVEYTELIQMQIEQFIDF
jgi:NAD(P)H-dependent FMN reductase